MGNKNLDHFKIGSDKKRKKPLIKFKLGFQCSTF